MAKDRPTTKDVRRWAEELDRRGGRVGLHFARPGPRRRAIDYRQGLRGDAERNNGWQLAEYRGAGRPYGVRHLVGRADWGAAARDDLRAYVLGHRAGPGGVLVVDETGFRKKGTKSAGVQRQYSGTAGRSGNCQPGVSLAFAGRRGRAFRDRAWYLPPEWAPGAVRRPGAGTPPGVTFATKPAPAKRRVERGRPRRCGRPG